MLRRNGPVVKSVESVLRLERSLWGETFVEEVGSLQSPLSSEPGGHADFIGLEMTHPCSCLLKL